MTSSTQTSKPAIPDRDRLLGIAVARGCTPYRDFADPSLISNDPSLPHELLGCALLQGGHDLATFQAMRVGGMVLSDRGNKSAKMAAFAIELGVAPRLARLAQVAISVGEMTATWRAVLVAVGVTPPRDMFFPSAKGFSLETMATASSDTSTPGRIWLRTDYHLDNPWRACRLRDLPEEERSVFREWLRGQAAPAIDGAPANEQDGYYYCDYLRWASRRERRR